MPGGSAVALRITDDGRGMDEETRRRCTEPFFTTKDWPAVTGLSGSGLGLAIVRAIAERVGGELLVESEIGKGTTVTMTLPAAGPEPPSASSGPCGGFVQQSTAAGTPSGSA